MLLIASYTLEINQVYKCYFTSSDSTSIILMAIMLCIDQKKSVHSDGVAVFLCIFCFKRIDIEVNVYGQASFEFLCLFSQTIVAASGDI